MKTSLKIMKLYKLSSIQFGNSLVSKCKPVCLKTTLPPNPALMPKSVRRETSLQTFCQPCFWSELSIHCANQHLHKLVINLHPSHHLLPPAHHIWPIQQTSLPWLLCQPFPSRHGVFSCSSCSLCTLQQPCKYIVHQ